MIRSFGVVEHEGSVGDLVLRSEVPASMLFGGVSM